MSIYAYYSSYSRKIYDLKKKSWPIAKCIASVSIEMEYHGQSMNQMCNVAATVRAANGRTGNFIFIVWNPQINKVGRRGKKKKKEGGGAVVVGLQQAQQKKGNMTQLRQRQVGFIHSRDFPPSTGEFQSLCYPVKKKKSSSDTFEHACNSVSTSGHSLKRKSAG